VDGTLPVTPLFPEMISAVSAVSSDTDGVMYPVMPTPSRKSDLRAPHKRACM
jgi:hypothetical protein